MCSPVSSVLASQHHSAEAGRDVGLTTRTPKRQRTSRSTARRRPTRVRRLSIESVLWPEASKSALGFSRRHNPAHEESSSYAACCIAGARTVVTTRVSALRSRVRGGSATGGRCCAACTPTVSALSGVCWLLPAGTRFAARQRRGAKRARENYLREPTEGRSPPGTRGRPGRPGRSGASPQARSDTPSASDAPRRSVDDEVCLASEDEVRLFRDAMNMRWRAAALRNDDVRDAVLCRAAGRLGRADQLINDFAKLGLKRPADVLSSDDPHTRVGP